MKKILLFSAFALVATFSTISHALADCNPAPKDQKIQFIANSAQDLFQLSDIYGILSPEDAQTLVAMCPSVTTTTTTTTTTTVVTNQTQLILVGSVGDQNVYINWQGPILGQCEYPGPGTPTW